MPDCFFADGFELFDNQVAIRALMNQFPTTAYAGSGWDEAQGTTLWTQSVGGTGRRSNQSMQVFGTNATPGFLGKNLPTPGTRACVTYCIRESITFGAAGWMPIIRMMEGSTVHVEVQIDSVTLAVRVVNGSGAVLAASAAGEGWRLVGFGGASPNWSNIEFDATVHDTTGAFTLRVWKSTVLSATNVNTRNGGTGVIDKVRVGSWGASGTSGYSIDDIAFSVNGLIGVVHVMLSKPVGTGANTGLTPNTGADWAALDENIHSGGFGWYGTGNPNWATDYIDGAVGQKSTFVMGDVTSSWAGWSVPTFLGILGVMPLYNLSITGAASRTARPVFRIGGVDYNGSNFTVGHQSTGAVAPAATLLNPATSLPWSVSDWNGAEFGIEVVS